MRRLVIVLVALAAVTSLAADKKKTATPAAVKPSSDCEKLAAHMFDLAVIELPNEAAKDPEFKKLSKTERALALEMAKEDFAKERPGFIKETAAECMTDNLTADDFKCAMAAKSLAEADKCD